MRPIITGVASIGLVLDGQLPGGANAVDAITTTAILNALMSSALIGASFEPLSEQGGETWVINTDTGASSLYESYSFNSFATIGGRMYGVRSDGLYLMEGSTDDGAPIRASLGFGSTDFDSDKLTRLEHAYIGVASTGRMFLRVILRDGTRYTYAARRNDSYMAVQRIDVGRGIRASYMEFELYNDAGCDFELNTVSFHAAELTRRI